MSLTPNTKPLSTSPVPVVRFQTNLFRVKDDAIFLLWVKKLPITVEMSIVKYGKDANTHQTFFLLTPATSNGFWPLVDGENMEMAIQPFLVDGEALTSFRLSKV